ncbi:glycoside hydrolase family 71 protein [Clavulina sp. PMI_390]|nr:glycoside hydrolase family 71 protein [Clavulina sp. PMI_390]
MVGNTYSYAQSDWETDIQLAQSAGIDGFALNVGSLDWESDRVADAYAAAEALNTGFKLFISLDMSSLACAATTDADPIRAYVNDYSAHPNQLWYSDNLILSAFDGTGCLFGQDTFDDGWNYALRNGAYANIWFIPAFFVDPSTFGSITSINGIFDWNAGWPSTDADISWTDGTWITDIGDRAYIAPVSPLFFTHYGPDSYNKNWIYRSDDWLFASRWEELITNRDSIDFVEIITWNDFGESHYIGPIAPDEDQPNSEAWTTGFDHQAYYAVNKYYATAWKTGTYPTITENQIFLTARPHSKSAVCTSDSVAQPTNAAWTDDNLYALVFAAQAGTVVLTIGSSTGTFSVTTGVNKLKIALAVGSPTAVFTSTSGATLVNFAPSGFSYTGSTCSVYNFNYYAAISS